MPIPAAAASGLLPSPIVLAAPPASRSNSLSRTGSSGTGESALVADKSPVDLLLAEQSRLTPVDRFSRIHDSGSHPRITSLYRELIPPSQPKAGQQFAFEVDIDKCSGCKACVTACHSLNGLEDNESWRGVGLLVGQAPAGTARTTEGVPISFKPSGVRHQASGIASPASIQRTITTACHHCVDPGCLNGCPVLAYEKDPVTGIVRHLDDQCIGCQYCVMKCPYEVPRYSARLGIVRKCDMCTQRLEAGEAPACVQACPNEAIRIRIVDVADILSTFRPVEPSAKNGHNNGTSDDGGLISFNSFLPGSPAPDITVPTTRFKSSLDRIGTLVPADAAAVRPSDPHLPLALMLPLSQLSAGIITATAVLGSSDQLKAASTAAVVVMAAALGIGTLHLGQPFRAWKAFLGWRKSWFSREAIAFGLYLKALAVLTATLWLKPDLLPSSLRPQVLGITASLGLLSVFCSVMLYVDTRRQFWSLGRTAGKFFGSTLLLGLAASAVLVHSQTLWLAISVAFVAKLAVEFEILASLKLTNRSELHRSARLITGHFRKLGIVRLALGAAGGLVVPGLVLGGLMSMTPVAGLVAASLLMAGEVCERVLFFAAVAPDKMPGGITT